MDNYPKEFSPIVDNDETKTPFAEWWATVAPAFPDVPGDVAEQWLHRHWGHSPYGWMRSKLYSFTPLEWPTARLPEIASGAHDWKFAEAVGHGRHMLENVPSYWLADYMKDHQDVPRPIIVLDNRCGCLKAQLGAPPYPAGYLVIEGHRRFAIASYLSTLGQFRPSIGVWLMEQISSV